MSNIEQPLISIIVVTYNSENYIADTLKSIKQQSYQNIELIVSDDCSTDNTCGIAENWIKNNRNRFIRTLFIKSEINTGVTQNCNRAYKESNGEYIKFIAGDDLLKSDCISNCTDYIQQSNDNILYAQFELIDKNSNRPSELIKNELRLNLISENFCTLSPEEQFKYLIFANYVSAPTIFIRTDFLKKLNGFDEDFEIEDYPFLLKISGKGYKINYLPKITVSYRIHDESISIKDTDGAFNRKYLKLYPKIICKYVSRQYFIRHPLIYLHYFLSYLTKNLTVLSGNRMYLYRIYKLLFLLSPYYVYKRLYSLITKKIFLFYY